MDLLEVCELGKGGLVAQRDVEETVVGEGAHSSDGCRLLATTEGAGGDEQTGVLAPETAGGPDATGAVPEGLPLSGEVTVAGGNTEEDSIERQELIGSSNGVGGLGRSVHLRKDLLGKGLLNPIQNVVRPGEAFFFFFLSFQSF